MRLSGAMDADEGVAVAAFVFEGEVDLQRRAAVALCASTAVMASGRARASAASSRYGGSRKTRSYERPLRDAPPRKRRASARTTVASAPSASRLAPIARIAGAALSTKVASFAPRDSASMPSAPEPANRSSTRASRTRSPRIENTASRTRSAVGRVSVPGGVWRRRPPYVPAITRTRQAACPIHGPPRALPRLPRRRGDLPLRAADHGVQGAREDLRHRRARRRPAVDQPQVRAGAGAAAAPRALRGHARLPPQQAALEHRARRRQPARAAPARFGRGLLRPGRGVAAEADPRRSRLA